MRTARPLIVTAMIAIFAFAGVYRTNGDDDLSDSDIRTALAKAKISLAEAVEIATKQVSGRAVEASIDADNGKIFFEVEVVDGKKHQEVTIDGLSGKLTAIEQESERQKANDEKKGEDEALETEAAVKAKTTLLEAIRSASKKVKGGQAFDAEFERHDGHDLCIEVQLWAEGKMFTAHVDAANGKVIEVKEDEE
jgi:uncharacterized membrane protein YkoI